MRIVALAGGVGGAKLSDGLARVLSPGKLTVVVNVGDDFDHFGLKICPDLDTVCYTLAGKANSKTGWGRSGESWRALDTIRDLGGPDWFHIGDRDIGLHLERTRQMRSGVTLSEFCQTLCDKWKIDNRILPVTNDRIETIVFTTTLGPIPFQEYFVREKFEPPVTGFSYYGAETALPAPGVLEDIEKADAVVICPSNPWVSIEPILAVPGIKEALGKKFVVAVSPIVNGRAIKGPAAKMFSELGLEASAMSVAKFYETIAGGFVLDQQDADQAPSIEALGITPLISNTIMDGTKARIQLAIDVLKLCSTKDLKSS
jgi:LPPG:FO 2-phospho-L-lactate transferase